MRPQNKSRSRNKNNNNNSNNNNRRHMGNIVNRVFDSAGPEGKVRGTPQQIIEKYQSLARDAQLSNDRVAAENFLQHSEHYSRMLGEALSEQAEMRQNGDMQQGDRSSAFEGNDGTDQRPQSFGQQQPYNQPSEPRETYDQPQRQPAAFEAAQPQPEMAAFEPVYETEAAELVATPENPPSVNRSKPRGNQNRARKPASTEIPSEPAAD